MPGLYFDSGIDKGFEKDLQRLNTQYNKFSNTVETKNDVMDRSFTKLGGTIAAAFGTAAIVRFGKDSVNLYRQQQKALAQVEQGLISTGNAAGKTFEQLQKEASDLQKNTLFGDEEILQGATAQLLTFTNIADDQFTRTQKVALDLATRLDGDLKSASIQLGKALNDPVANLSALSRSGIQFSKEQKDLIKTLAETGRLAEAQTVILDELEQQYGGSAEAAAKADGGFTQLSNTIGDVQEVIGSVIVEALQPFIAELQEFLNGLSDEDIRDFVENVKDGAKVIGILIAALTAWKLTLLTMNKIQKINTFLTTLDTKAKTASAEAGRKVSKANVLMAGSLKKVKAAFLGSGIGLLVAGLTELIPLINEFTNETSTAVKVQNAINEVNAEAGKSIAGQKVQLDQLLEIARDETQSLQDRESAIKELNKISPEFLGQLNLQTINTKEAEAATKAYTESLLRNARAQAAQAKLVQIEQELIDLQTQAQVESSTRWQQFVNGVTNAGDAEGYLEAQRNSEFQNAVKRGRELIAIRKELTKTIIEGAGKEILLNKNKTQAGGVTKGTKDSIKAFEKLLQQQKKAYQQYNKDIEGLTGQRLEVVQKEYKDLIKQGESYLEFLNNLLSKEKNAKKQTIIKREIDVTTLKNTILEQKAAEELFKKTQEDLATLEEAYRTYSQKRNDIETEFNAKILKLRKAGFTAQAAQAQKALDVELRRLEDSILSQNALFQEWVSEDLPKIAKTGVEALRKELDNIQIALETEGLAPEQVLAYQKQIDILKKKLKEKLAIEKESPQTWKDTLELINGINALIETTLSDLDIFDDKASRIIKNFVQIGGSLTNLVTGVQAVGKAMKGLEKSSAILAVISTAIQLVTVLIKSSAEAVKAVETAYINELKALQSVNLALIEQNRLYKEGNEFFASDKWGTVLTGLESYNQALDYQEVLLQNIIDKNITLEETAYGSLTGSEERIEQIKETALGTASALEVALDSIQVRTKDRSGLVNFIGVTDDYAHLLDIYPDLIDENDQLNQSLAETIINVEDIGGAEKAQLESLLEVVRVAEEAYGQFGDYISSIFGGVADDITKAFQVMYESSQLGIDETIDAMKSLEVSFSEMIEAFTRDAIEFAFLSPYLNELNEATKALGEQYASGAITADELQQGVIGTLGGFYDQMAELQPTILQAFQNADESAAAAGFESAFNPEDINIETPADTDIEIPDAQVETNIVETVSTPGAITQAITEETGSVLAGRIGALVLSNEKILLANNDMLDYAVQHLTYMKQIKLNTDYLPAIAENTRKTYEKLDSV